MDALPRIDYRNRHSLAYRLHERARRERAKAVGDLFLRLFARLSRGIRVPRPASGLSLRWG
jgi:hypothetical protein